LLEALEAVVRYRKPSEPVREPLRVMVTRDGDVFAAETEKVARWIEEGQTLVHALASLVAEFRARAEAAEQESQRLREQAAVDRWDGAAAERARRGAGRCRWSAHFALQPGGIVGSEQARLEWGHADVLTGLLTVPLSKNGQARRVPMNAAVRSALIDVGASRQHPADPTERVFSLSYRQVNRLLGKAVERAQGALRDAGKDASRRDGFTWHGLRHSFASRLVMNGVDLLTVKELGGWKTLAMVQRYAHLAPDHLRAAVDGLVRGAESRVELERNVNTTPAVAEPERADVS
jgi:integrase